MSRRALLIVNPASRRGDTSRKQAVYQLKQFDFDLIDQSGVDQKRIAQSIRSHGKQVDLVVIGGGDGTIHSALEGLVDTGLPLGILPLGTANSLARTLGLPFSLAEACKTIAEFHVHRIDLGWVNGKYFLNAAGVGLSTEVNLRLSKRIKHHWGILAYVLTAFQTIWRIRPFKAEILWNGQAVKVKAIQITVGNGRYYGSGLVLAEDAAVDDQRLDVYSIEAQPWWRMVFLLPALLLGRPMAGRGILTLRGREFILSTRKARLVTADGEPATRTPAVFRVVPRILPVFIPLNSRTRDRSSTVNRAVLNQEG